MDLSPEARLGLRSSRRFGRAVALDEGPSLALDKRWSLSLFLEECRRQLALPARHSKRTTGLLRVEGGFLLSGQALKLAVATTRYPIIFSPFAIPFRFALYLSD